MPKLNSQKKCDACQVCTNHVYDQITNSWARCDRADSSLFYSSINSIPPKYRHSQWSDYLQDTPQRKKAFDFAKAVYLKLCDNQLPKKSVVFAGKEFTGKTFISSILLRALSLKDFSCSFVQLSILLDLYFQDKEAFYEYSKQDVLVIQMGSEIVNSSIPFVIKELYTRRSQNNKYTLFTSKFFISEFEQRYGKELRDFFSLDLFKEIRMK